MADIVLPVVGGVTGFILGGPSGAIIGANLGYTASGILFPKSQSVKLPTQEGPRLADLRAQTSTYGNMIPKVYGTMRLAGNVLWATDIKEVQTETTTTQTSGGGGKGGGGGSVTTSQTSITYEYFITLAIGICEGPIDEVIRVWADSKVLTEDILSSSEGKYNVHLGDETQQPDDIIGKHLPAGEYPAYRGQAYVVIEDFPLAEYGNRIPNFTFEVRRTVKFSPSVEDKVKDIVMIPGAGEFVYGTDITTKQDGYFGGQGFVPSGNKSFINMHNYSGKADALLAIDQLGNVFPNLEWVAVVITWFATSTDAGTCDIIPKVEFQGTTQVLPNDWNVAGISRSAAQVVLELEPGVPTYGGTPSDKTVIQICQELKTRGYNVMFYPLIFVDQVTPDPKPWRGRITPANATDANNWFTKVNGYNAFITHYANLSVGGTALKNVVDAFVIGSEMVGMTSFTDTPGNYPAVNQFVSLAATVKAAVGSVQVTYAADWSEYHHDANAYYNLDPLWASSDIDFVGVDSYFPLTPDLPQIQITPELITQYWEDGEGWFYFFDDADNRTSDLTTDPFTTVVSSDIVTCDFINHNLGIGAVVTFAGTAGDPGGIPNADIDGKRIIIDVPTADSFTFQAGSVASSSVTAGGSAVTINKPKYFTGFDFAWKNLEYWWGNTHINPDMNPTSWTSKMKPVWFTEFGFPSVDGAANQPNVFYDPTSSESFFPRASKGRVDFKAQREALEATLDYLEARTLEPGNSNLVPRRFIWTWDARPFSFWPDLEGVWQDSVLWQTGHWVNGKLGNSTLGAIVAELLELTGLTVSDYDVSKLSETVEGYILLQPITVRSALEQLAAGYFFDCVESDGILKFVPRGNESVMDIPEDDLVPTTKEGIDDILGIIYTQELELPQRVNVTYIDRPFNYEPVTQVSQRQTVKAVDQITLNLPIVMGATLAKQVADITLYGAWKERISFDLTIPPEYVRIEPTDVITVTVNNVPHEMRVIKTDMERHGLMKVTAVAEDISSYDFYTPPGESGGTIETPLLVPDTLIEFVDAPPLPTDTITNQGLIRMGVAPDGANWNGAAIYRSDDGGENGGNTFNLLAGLDAPAVFGAIITNLEDGVFETWDENNTVDVILTSGTLISVNELAILNGSNAALIGNELVQFQNATLIDESTYRLSRLLRGRQGTEWAMDSHTAGDRFILLSPALYTTTMTNNNIGKLLFYKAVTVGNTLSTTEEKQFTYTGNNLRPFAPVHVKGSRDFGGDLTITWIRRTRVNGDWLGYVDVPLGETSEQYEVDILDGAEVVRTLTGTTPTVVYTASDQTTDFGSPQASVDIKIYQLSENIGRGYPAIVTV